MDLRAAIVETVDGRSNNDFALRNAIREVKASVRNTITVHTLSSWHRPSRDVAWAMDGGNSYRCVVKVRGEGGGAFCFVLLLSLD